MSEGADKDLVQAARDAREHAYAPYSGFQVGSALRARSGRIFTGCNVENSSYGLTICSERVALSKAVSEGESEFDAIVVCAPGAPAPCGACRQVLYEFSPELVVFLVDPQKDAVGRVSLKQLLPSAFDGSSLSSTC
ncbi:MAG TPA: cytidine deaminase [Verrucomicrobiales bacterium]|nr:cytidine deaminase [Roseibacillus sp.]HBM76483.1 cytidine deaminase [Verrucomicrobiales bacterium]HCQ38347.1 cytidine deaminase [Verrucomicrobiales bacterium]